MQSQRAAGSVAFSAHRAVCRAAVAFCGANGNRACLGVRAFECQMYLHGLPLIDWIDMGDSAHGLLLPLRPGACVI